MCFENIWATFTSSATGDGVGSNTASDTSLLRLAGEGGGSDPGNGIGGNNAGQFHEYSFPEADNLEGEE